MTTLPKPTNSIRDTKKHNSNNAAAAAAAFTAVDDDDDSYDNVSINDANNNNNNSQSFVLSRNKCHYQKRQQLQQQRQQQQQQQLDDNYKYRQTKTTTSTKIKSNTTTCTSRFFDTNNNNKKIVTKSIISSSKNSIELQKDHHNNQYSYNNNNKQSTSLLLSSSCIRSSKQKCKRRIIKTTRGWDKLINSPSIQLNKYIPSLHILTELQQLQNYLSDSSSNSNDDIDNSNSNYKIDQQTTKHQRDINDNSDNNNNDKENYSKEQQQLLLLPVQHSIDEEKHLLRPVNHDDSSLIINHDDNNDIDDDFDMLLLSKESIISKTHTHLATTTTPSSSKKKKRTFGSSSSRNSKSKMKQTDSSCLQAHVLNQNDILHLDSSVDSVLQQPPPPYTGLTIDLNSSIINNREKQRLKSSTAAGTVVTVSTSKKDNDTFINKLSTTATKTLPATTTTTTTTMILSNNTVNNNNNINDDHSTTDVGIASCNNMDVNALHAERKLIPLDQSSYTLREDNNTKHYSTTSTSPTCTAVGNVLVDQENQHQMIHTSSSRNSSSSPEVQSTSCTLISIDKSNTLDTQSSSTTCINDIINIDTSIVTNTSTTTTTTNSTTGSDELLTKKILFTVENYIKTINTSECTLRIVLDMVRSTIGLTKISKFHKNRIKEFVVQYLEQQQQQMTKSVIEENETKEEDTNPVQQQQQQQKDNIEICNNNGTMNLDCANGDDAKNNLNVICTDINNSENIYQHDTIIGSTVMITEKSSSFDTGTEKLDDANIDVSEDTFNGCTLDISTDQNYSEIGYHDTNQSVTMIDSTAMITSNGPSSVSTEHKPIDDLTMYCRNTNEVNTITTNTEQLKYESTTTATNVDVCIVTVGQISVNKENDVSKVVTISNSNNKKIEIDDSILLSTITNCFRIMDPKKDSFKDVLTAARKKLVRNKILPYISKRQKALLFSHMKDMVSTRYRSTCSTTTSTDASPVIQPTNGNDRQLHPICSNDTSEVITTAICPTAHLNVDKSNILKTVESTKVKSSTESADFGGRNSSSTVQNDVVLPTSLFHSSVIGNENEVSITSSKIDNPSKQTALPPRKGTKRKSPTNDYNLGVCEESKNQVNDSITTAAADSTESIPPSPKKKVAPRRSNKRKSLSSSETNVVIDASVEEQPTAKVVVRRPARKGACTLCAKCPCTIISKEIIDYSHDATELLSSSSIEIEKVLIKRLRKLEVTANRYDEQRETMRRRLVKHRREMWKKYESTTSRSLVGSYKNRNKEHYLPGANQIDQQMKNGRNIKKRLSDTAVAKAQRTVFGRTPNNGQRTLTQMMTLDFGSANKEDTEDRHESEMVNTLQPEYNMEEEDDDDNTSTVCSENSTYEENNYCHDISNHSEMKPVRLDVNGRNQTQALGLEQDKYSLWASINDSNFDCRFDRMFYSDEEAKCGVEHLIHLLGSDLDDHQSSQATPLQRTMDSPTTMLEFKHSQQSSPLLLSQRGKKLAEQIVQQFTNRNGEVESITKQCPQWQENVEYAMSRSDMDEISDALANVQQSRVRLQKAREVLLKSFDEKESVLNLYEEALRVSQTRLPVQQMEVVSSQQQSLNDTVQTPSKSSPEHL